MPVEIGSYDAKTRLPELLREVQTGQRYTITLRGKPVADLVPSEQTLLGDARTAVAAMRAFKKVRGLNADTVGEWVAEGRR
ncbi:MAG: type II toxin-antitoxin system prevent-host-death family antitoxin [Gammaproteobacteria bacterium]|jgi:prevent-host-death family protein|nr:type II toxin-antitoxin system prevent-host-death family antitoxin [Gammaproteobacteria bacterium]